MFAIRLTHRPSATFGSDAPEAVDQHTYFGGFRARTGRAAATYGQKSEVTITNGHDGQRAVKTWINRETAERNLHHLIARGWKGEVKNY